jgi:anti-sigma factor RsiW
MVEQPDSDDDWRTDNCGVRVPLRIEEERRMSSTIEELGQRDTLLEVEYDIARREAQRAELARDVAAQHERLHTLRATVLEELTKQRRVTLPRWPSGPKVTQSLVDEDDWWEKMLGRKRAA